MLLDTNYLIRLVTGKPLELATEAAMALDRQPAQTVNVPDYVVSEAVYVLEFHEQYSFPRQQIADSLLEVLSHPAIDFEAALHVQAFKAYTTHKKLDYVDSLLVAQAKQAKSGVLTFDKNLQKALGEAKT